MTWNELKQFCDSLDEKQLKKEVILFKEEEIIHNINSDILKEDYYYDPENSVEGCFPESEAPGSTERLKKVYDKNMPHLWEAF